MLTSPSLPDDAAADATGESALCGADALAPLHPPDGHVPRDAALGAFRRKLARIQSHVQQEFERGHLSGLEAAALLARLTDGVIAELHRYAAGAVIPLGEQRLALAATGGYGRGVLAPFSDIDLLFLTEAEPSPGVLQVVEFMLYFLWDLGLKVGHATRSVAGCLAEAQSDITVRTSLLDARHLAGDRALFDDFEVRFAAACQAAGAGEFIAAKQAERAARHRRYGDSPFLVEPNIKEGRGALRDLQTVYWMARYVFGTGVFDRLADPAGPAGALLNATEARLGRRSMDFLWSVRFHLHYVAGRAEERLTFDLQPVVGARMGYTRHGRQDGVERFMRHYFLTAREVNRLTHVLEPAIVRAALGAPAIAPGTDQALVEAGFMLAEGRLMPISSQAFHDTPVQMLRILQVARDRDLELHPLALRALIRNERQAVRLRDDPEASAIFLDLLCGRDAEHNHADGARWLSVLNETGFLGRLIPDWARIVGQMQFDTYHVFTVDEHTIEAVRVVNALERGALSDVAPIASGLVDHLQSRRALYMATLLHDIAKGRGGDHSELGAEIALAVGPALGLSAEETETISWLVLHHLLLSQTAFKRDIDDPKTILDLADTIQSPERLRLLLVLTVADMRAVSPKVWNGWKATLLRELYARVAEVLAGGLATTERDTRVARAREAAANLLGDWTQPEIDHFLELGYPSYWLSFDPETHARHARLVRDAERRHAPLTVDTQPMPARAVTEVTTYAADHAGLFSRIAGALAVAGASIVDARIHTMTNGMALDTFWIQDAAGGTFDAPHRLARLYVLIEQALSGRIRLGAEIRRLSKSLIGQRMRAIHVPPRVVIDNRVSNTHTVLEVNGRDRPGLLHDVTAAISEQGLQIASAHVTTYGVRAVDVFYVKDVFGLKVENDRKLGALREALLAALGAGDQTAPRPVATPRRRRAGAA
jgi:[protein-PII] uridylyltransferase